MSHYLVRPSPRFVTGPAPFSFSNAIPPSDFCPLFKLSILRPYRYARTMHSPPLPVSLIRQVPSTILKNNEVGDIHRAQLICEPLHVISSALIKVSKDANAKSHSDHGTASPFRSHSSVLRWSMGHIHPSSLCLKIFKALLPPRTAFSI